MASARATGPRSRWSATTTSGCARSRTPACGRRSSTSPTSATRFGTTARSTNRALKEDRPEFATPDPDAIARDEGYNDVDPAEALDGLEQQSTRFATRARSLTDDDLDRVVVRAGSEITVRYMVGNVAHEGHHHLQDVQRLLA